MPPQRQPLRLPRGPEGRCLGRGGLPPHFPSPGLPPVSNPPGLIARERSKDPSQGCTASADAPSPPSLAMSLATAGNQCTNGLFTSRTEGLGIAFLGVRRELYQQYFFLLLITRLDLKSSTPWSPRQTEFTFTRMILLILPSL